jgi:hypothetical protein
MDTIGGHVQKNKLVPQKQVSHILSHFWNPGKNKVKSKTI